MKLLYCLLAWSLMIASTSCEPEEDLYRRFDLRQGEHYATPKIVESLQSSRLTFFATFDESCRYVFEEAGHQNNKNKLMGFSDCNSMHHENSARFAWQWFNDRLEIYAYCYVNGNRVEQFLGTVDIGKENRYEIQVIENAYVFTLNHQEPIKITRSVICSTGVYYMLWPYFGGSLPAPHDMHLSIKMVY